MGLLQCKECGGMVSSQAKACPACGAPLEVPASPSVRIAAALLLIAAVIVGWALMKRANDDSESEVHREAESIQRRIDSDQTREETESLRRRIAEGNQQSRSERAGALPEIAIRTSSEKLVTEYADNGVRADGMYKGQLVEVTGEIGHVGKDLLDTAYVTLKGPSDRIRSVQCYFDKKDENRLSRLRPGQTAAIRGRCKGLMGNVIVENCSIRGTSY